MMDKPEYKKNLKDTKDIKQKKNTVEEIARKLEKLEKLKMVLKDPRISVEDIDEEELDALLSRNEVMEEALKNYMYQFGMSLYQNKKGDNYFKKFAYGTDIRNYGELDSHNFFVNDQEPSFFEKLFEYSPPERVDLKGSIQNVVYDLYERDASMVDAFNEVVSEEMERCKDILEHVQEAMARREVGQGKQLDEVVDLEQLQQKMSAEDEIVFEDQKEKSIDEDEDIRVISVEEIEVDLLPDDDLSNEMIDEWSETYESGSEYKGEGKVRLPRVDKVRRVSKPKTPPMPQKDNSNDR